LRLGQGRARCKSADECSQQRVEARAGHGGAL
jgi:hypothetical protein